MVQNMFLKLAQVLQKTNRLRRNFVGVFYNLKKKITCGATVWSKTLSVGWGRGEAILDKVG